MDTIFFVKVAILPLQQNKLGKALENVARPILDGGKFW